MSSSAKLFGNVFGAVYLAIGLIGFALSGLDGFVATQGEPLMLFEINPLHNVVHVVVGAALLAGAVAGEKFAREVALLVVGVYGLLGLVGFALIGSGANILALNPADNFLHLTTAAVAFIAVARSRREALAHGDFGG